MARLMLRRSRSAERLDEAEPTPADDATSLWDPGSSPDRSRPRLGELLILRGRATTGQVSEALLKQPGTGKRLGVLLLEMGVLDERDLVEALAEQLGLALADLRRESPVAEALELLPESVARANLALPVRVTDEHLEVAVAEPSDGLRRLLAEGAGRPVRLLLAAPGD